MQLDDRVVALAEKIFTGCLGAMTGKQGPLFMQGKVDHIALGAITSAQSFFETRRKYEAALSGKAAPQSKQTQHAKNADDLLQQIAAEAAAARESEREATADNGAVQPTDD